MGNVAAILLLVVTMATTTRAQKISPGITASVTTYGTFGVEDLEGDLPTSAEFRFTVPISEKQAVEPFVTVGSSHNGSARVEGLHGLQILHRVGPPLADRKGYLLVTYGAAGSYPIYAADNGIFGLFGFGLHHRVTGHVAVRPEVRLVTLYVVPIGAQFTVGLSFQRGN